MQSVSTGEQWKMNLLTGRTSASEATDILMDRLVELSNREVLDIILPMAELRASQIEKGLESTDFNTYQEAGRMEYRYLVGGNTEKSDTELQAAEAVASLPGEYLEMTRAVAGNWLGRIIGNERIGEMEKELDRTVATYRTEKRESRVVLTHSIAR